MKLLQAVGGRPFVLQFYFYINYCEVEFKCGPYPLIPAKKDKHICTCVDEPVDF